MNYNKNFNIFTWLSVSFNVMFKAIPALFLELNLVKFNRIKLIPKGFFYFLNNSLPCNSYLGADLLISEGGVFKFASNSNKDLGSLSGKLPKSLPCNSKLAAIGLALARPTVGSISRKTVLTNSKIVGIPSNLPAINNNLNKIIIAFFKSIYCLISKPKFIHTPDKIIIEILYYIAIPDHNIFKWHNFIYNTGQKTNISNNIVNNREILTLTKSITKVKRNKSLKTILFKNFLIKQTLFNLNNSNIAIIYLNKFNIFFKFLSSYFFKPIEFNLIRVHKSDYEVNILAQLFVLILKKKNIRIAINKIYNKNNIGLSNIAQAANNTIVATKASILNRQDIGFIPYSIDNQGNPKVNTFGNSIAINYIPAIISGLYIHIGGRLMREPIIPRLTTKKFEKGAIATGKVNFLDSARITKKNKKGAYTIKIAYAQNLVTAQH